jgi:hypothetical protein
LSSLPQWWNGPDFLHSEQSHYDDASSAVLVDVPELRAATAALTSVEHFGCDILSSYSSFLKLQRILSYVLRFIRKLKSQPCDRKVVFLSLCPSLSTSLLSAQECCDATRKAIYLAQCAVYCRNSLFENGLLLPRSSNLHTFLDSCDFLRVGGILIIADLTYVEKNQLIIPANHRLADH